MTRFLFRWSAKQKAFAPNFLGVRLPVDGGSLSVDKFDCTKTKEISVTLPWPAWLCRPDGQLCLASALAISDEVSTFGMAAWDKSLRPGVSVVLSGQRETMTSTIEAGEEITFHSRLIKEGATLAWIHLECRRGDELLATGRHLKFQPTGLPPGWQLLSHPLARPALFTAMRFVTERQPDASSAAPLPPADATRRQVLSLIETPSLAADARAAPSALPTPLLADGVSPVGLTAALSSEHGNPGRTLHGGCATMILDEACGTSYMRARGVPHPPAVQRMSVSLLGAIGVGKRTTAEAIAATSAQEQRAHAILRKPGKGEPAVEADVWW